MGGVSFPPAHSARVFPVFMWKDTPPVSRRRSTTSGYTSVRVVSACLDRPLRIGGWDSLNRRPLPLRSVLPAGSVLFCELAEPRRFLDAMTDGVGLPALGERQAFGFGAVALGAWPDGSEAT